MITLDLLPGGRRRTTTAVIATAVVAACVAVLYGYHLHEQRAAARAAAAQEEVRAAAAADVAKRLDAARKTRAALAAELAARQRVAGDRRVVVELVEGVSRSLPDGVRLTELVRNASSVEIEGRASSFASVTAFARELGSQVAFAGPVDIRSMSAEEVEGARAIRFRIAGQLAATVEKPSLEAGVLEPPIERPVAGASTGGPGSEPSAVALAALEREIDRLTAAIRPSRDGLGARTDAASLFAELESAASGANVTLTAARPRRAPGGTPAGGATNDGVSIEADMEGAFHDIGHFLTTLASSTHVMTVSELSMTSRPERVAGTIVIVSAGGPAPASADVLAEYDDGGRRDPFAGVVVPATSPERAADVSRGKGLGATPLSDVIVRGVARAGARRLAILETAAKESFVVRTADRLADAIVREIDGTGVVFTQPRGRGEPAEVRKPLGPASGGRR